MHCIVARPKQRLLAQLLEAQEPGSKAIVDIVIVIGDCIRNVGQLSFEAWLLTLQETLADVAKLARILR